MRPININEWRFPNDRSYLVVQVPVEDVTEIGFLIHSFQRNKVVYLDTVMYLCSCRDEWDYFTRR